jgi:hypothetical protein
MKIRTVLLSLAFAVLFAPATYAAGYVYAGNVDVPNETLGAVALTDSGDIYYVTFAGATSNFVFVDNAIGGLADDSYTTTLISTEVLPSGRGLNDVEVDATGNIYISGTGTAGADTVLKKFGPAPTHTELWSMQSLAAGEQIRHNGIELIDADTLAISEAWNNIRFKNTSDGLNKAGPVTGGSSYQRSLAFNPTNNDIYVGKNGSSVSSCLKVFSGGSPTTLASYALALDNLLDPYGNNTTFGSATQAVDYDNNNGELIVADNNDQATSGRDPNQGARIFTVSGTGASAVFTEVQAIIDRNSVIYNNCYGISYARVGSVDYLALAVQLDPDSTPGNGDEFWSIDVYGIPPAGVTDWTLRD